MSGRRIRNLILLALVVGVGYWYYKERPTLGGFIDGITEPLFGSRAAVKESERKRVIDDASTVITQQTDENVGMLRLGMSMSDVRDLLGSPDKTEVLTQNDPIKVRWDYRVVKRSIFFENGRVASIAVR